MNNNLPFVLVGMLPRISPLLIKTKSPFLFLFCPPEKPRGAPYASNYFTQPPFKQTAFPFMFRFPFYLCESLFLPCETRGGPFCRPRSVTPSSTNGPREFPFVFLLAMWHGMAPSRRNPVVLQKTPGCFDFPKNTFFWGSRLLALPCARMLHVLVALEPFAVRSSVEEVPAVGIPE